MNVQDVVSYAVELEIVDHYTQAPNYGEDVKMVKLTKVIIVGQGTKSGKPSIDLQMQDADGNKYLVMTTGTIFQEICSGITGLIDRGIFTPPNTLDPSDEVTDKRDISGQNAEGPEIEELREIAKRANVFYKNVMPQIGGVCLHDYENMNKLGILLEKHVGK